MSPHGQCSPHPAPWLPLDACSPRLTPSHQSSPLSRCPAAGRLAPAGLRQVSPLCPAPPSRHPAALARGPSPARRVPQLHRLHGAAGSHPDPLTAPSSSRTSPSLAHRHSHTSAFRPYRKRRAARRVKRGGAARDDSDHVVRGLSHVGASGPEPRVADSSSLRYPERRSTLLATMFATYFS